MFEAMRSDPIGNHLVELGVTGITVFHPLLKNIVEFRLQCPDVPGGGRARRHELLPVFVEFDDVEVVAAVGCGCGAGPRAFAGAEKGQPGRQGEGLLTTGEKNVDAEVIHRNRHGGK